jgi:hypothetical protein
MAAKCNVCNIRRPKTGSKGTETSPHNDMCNYCWEEGGMENQHSDSGHDTIAKLVASGAQLTDYAKGELAFMEGCWICHPELNLAKLPAKAATGTTKKEQGFRRPQLNHKGHSHPATPAARRACKALFWAELAKQGRGWDVATLADFTKWDAKLDGFGKPVAPAPAKLTVVPRGPKGGVINQLKKGNPAK